MVSEKKYRYRFRKNLVSEKSLGFGFGKFGLTKKYWFRKNFVSEISLGFGFGKFVIGKKVPVSVLENLVWEKSLGIGFGQNFGIVIQCP